MTQQAIIVIEDLYVRYGAVEAVRGLSLQVPQGSVFGMLGPNGAGKSSTLACIEGLQQPEGGRVLVAGHDMRREPQVVKALLGVQLQKSALFSTLNACELIELYAALYNVFPGRSGAIKLLDRFGLNQKQRARAGQLSGGQQQRLALAIATVNNPQIVLLDEPTSGLDPQARRGVWALIRRMQAEGRTVLLTTHAMEEAEELCDAVAIIDGGRLVAEGSPQALIARHAPPLSPREAERRKPNLEDVFLALTGHGLNRSISEDDEIGWLQAAH